MHAHTLQAQTQHACWHQAAHVASNSTGLVLLAHSQAISSEASSDSRAPGQVGDKLDDLRRQPDLLVASDAGNDVEDAGYVLQ